MSSVSMTVFDDGNKLVWFRMRKRGRKRVNQLTKNEKSHHLEKCRKQKTGLKRERERERESRNQIKIILSDINASSGASFKEGNAYDDQTSKFASFLCTM